MADMLDSPIPEWLDVSRETTGALQHFAAMVRQWTVRINLVSASTLPDLWSRHVLDSAQLFDLAPAGASWVDLGSGGGFPGIVLAIIAKEKAPLRRFHLVESDQRKAAFLRKAALELQLNVTVHAARAEALAPLAAATLSARAMAPLPDLLAHVHRHLAPGGCALLPKGAKAQEEIDAARRTWAFDLDLRPSRTDATAQILKIENLHHA